MMPLELRIPAPAELLEPLQNALDTFSPPSEGMAWRNVTAFAAFLARDVLVADWRDAVLTAEQVCYLQRCALEWVRESVALAQLNATDGQILGLEGHEEVSRFASREGAAAEAYLSQTFAPYVAFETRIDRAGLSISWRLHLEEYPSEPVDGRAYYLAEQAVLEPGAVARLEQLIRDWQAEMQELRAAMGTVFQCVSAIDISTDFSEPGVLVNAWI